MLKSRIVITWKDDDATTTTTKTWAQQFAAWQATLSRPLGWLQ
jgi:hypothetical protein